MDARVVRQLGVERRDQEAPLADEHGLAVQLRQHLDVGAGLAHARRADEDAAQRLVVAGELEVGLEARDLPAVGVAVDVDVDETRGASRSSTIIPAHVPNTGRVERGASPPRARTGASAA